MELWNVIAACSKGFGFHFRGPGAFRTILVICPELV